MFDDLNYFELYFISIFLEFMMEFRASSKGKFNIRSTSMHSKPISN
jgi:hypothetical protein